MVVPSRRFQANKNKWKAKYKAKEIVAKKTKGEKELQKKRPSMKEFLESLKGDK